MIEFMPACDHVVQRQTVVVKVIGLEPASAGRRIFPEPVFPKESLCGCCCCRLTAHATSRCGHQRAAPDALQKTTAGPGVVGCLVHRGASDTVGGDRSCQLVHCGLLFQADSLSRKRSHLNFQLLRLRQETRHNDRDLGYNLLRRRIMDVESCLAALFIRQ